MNLSKAAIRSVMIAAAVWCTGCVMAPPENVPPMDRRVTIAENVGTDLYVTDVRCAKVNNGLFLTLQANVVNNTYSQYSAEWKVVWLDADGMEIDSLASTWNRRAIQPKDIVPLKMTAPSTDAADMRIFIRKMK